MFALDLFNTVYERALNEGAVDDLEARYIHGLNTKMLDLMDRARSANPEMKAALKREFEKVKADRDSFYKIKEAGIPGSVPVEKIPGKEDLLKGKGRSYYESDDTIVSQNPTPVNTANDDARAWKREILQNYAKLGRMRTEAMWALENNVYMNKDQILDYVAQKSQDPSLSALEYMHDLGYEVDGLFKNVSRFLTGAGVSPAKIQSIQNKINKQMGEINERRLPEEAQAKTDDALRAHWEKLKREKQSGTPSSVPTNKIPGKEDLLKGKGRSYYEGSEEGWSKETPWTKTPKGKSGKPVDPRGEVTHLSDVARREAERKASQDQKKNSEEIDEHGGGIGPKQHWQDLMQERKLNVGDPIIVTAPNEFEGSTGEISEFSPSGKFVVVNLYNHGEHSMHLSDVEFNQYAANQEDEDDWYDDEELNEFAQFLLPAAMIATTPVRGVAAGLPNNPLDLLPGDDEVDEGWSNKMVARRTGQAPTPYSVYIKGKEWKSFPDDDHAENVANKLRAKFEAEGRDPGVITIAPTGYDKDIKEAEGRVDPILLKALKRMPDGLATHREVLDAAYDAYAMEKGYLAMKGNYGVTDVYIPKLMSLYKDKHGLTFNEAGTDYSKRRQRDRDVDAGKSVARQRQSKMTDYQKRRAQQKKEMELGEDQDTSGVESAIIRRIMVAHTDLLKQFGPEKVMQAAEEVAYNVGDVDEIGTSDVSAYVHQVKQILGAV